MAARRSAIGGAGDEAGGEYRRGVAALFAAYGLNGLAVPDLPFGSPAVVRSVALETDDPVDDVVVGFTCGRLFIQAKRSLNLGRPLRDAAKQWVAAAGDPSFDPSSDIIAIATGSLTGTADELRQALIRGRAGERLSDRQTESLNALRKILGGAGADAETQERVLQCAHIMRLEVEEAGDGDAARGTLLLDGHVVRKGEGQAAWSALVATA